MFKKYLPSPLLVLVLAGILLGSFFTAWAAGPIDFGQLEELADRVEIRYRNLRYNRQTGEISADVILANTSNEDILCPLVLVVTDISVPAVALTNGTGIDPNGDPYIDLTDALGDDEVLAPGEATVPTRIVFYNPSRQRFTFNETCLGVIVLAPPPAPILDSHSTSTSDSTVTITGTATRAEMVEVAGPEGQIEVIVDGSSQFSVDIPLGLNRVNQIFFTSVDADGQRSAPAATSVAQDSQSPTLQIQFPSDGAEITTEVTDVAGIVGDLLSGFAGLEVTVNGVPAIVDVGIGTNGTFLAESVSLPLGQTTEIVATAMDALGNEQTSRVNVTRVEIPADAPRIVVVSGNSQMGPIEETLPAPLVVRLTDSFGAPFANKVVTFNVRRSNGGLSGDPSDPGTLMYQTRTDSNGEAQAFWRMGSDAGCGNNRVEVTSLDIIGTTAFCASATPGPPDQINIGSGNSQRVETNAPAPLPLQVWVSDSCNGVEGVPVTFTVTEGSGKVNGQDSVVVDTSNTGHAEVNYFLGATPGNNRVEATFNDNAGTPATFVVFGLQRDENTPTSFSGVVLDNGSNPIGGARCALTVNGQLQPITFTTEDGMFAFDDIPDGAGDLEIDGSVANLLGGSGIPEGSFPALHYEVVVIPNAENSLPTPVLLPPLNPNNAVTFDNTQDVDLMVEGIDGLKMTVQAGSMTRSDGTVPSETDPVVLSLNQVHHDDVPMPMPDGAAPQFAWTLQPAGATFDPPIKLQYPNMSALAPGSVAYFLSFDHDTGKFEIVAPGTVSVDGSTIISDPGTGLTLAGWGCNCPPYSVAGCCEKCSMEWTKLGDKYGFDNFTSMDSPWKSVEVGQSDTVLGKIDKPDDPTLVSFKSSDTSKVGVTPGTASSKSQTVTVNGVSKGTSTIDAIFTDPDRNEKKCAKFRVAAYPKKTATIAVTLIHEKSGGGEAGYNSTDISDATISAELAKVYKQSVQVFTLVRRPAVTVEFDLNDDGKVDVDSWMSAEMRVIRDAATSAHDFNIFLVDKPSDGSLGFMDYNQKYGFVHADKGNGPNTLAHELGHGQGLKHTPGDAKNLMHPTNANVTELRKKQWDQLNP